MESELRRIMSQMLTDEARSRLGTIKATKPDFAMQLQVYILQLYQQGMVKGQIDDNMLKQIIGKISAKPGWNIRRK